MTLPYVTFEDLRAACDAQTSEGLQLEFKCKEDRSTPHVSKGDRRAIAKSVSSLSNSDGGILVFGVETKREGSADVAASLHPIADIETFRREFDTVCALNISPQPNLTQTRVIEDPEAPGYGYLVCAVERSARRPHMSTAPGDHRYYRRAFEGVVAMTPSEVRDQVLAVRDASLVPSYRLSFPSWSSGDDWVTCKCKVDVYLQNEGLVTCRNPYLRARSPDLPLGSAPNFSQHSQSWRWSPEYGTLIHPDDEVASLSIGLAICVVAYELSVQFHIGKPDLTSSVLVLPFDQFSLTTVTDKVSFEDVELNVSYGAENAPRADAQWIIPRKRFAQEVLQQKQLAQMMVPRIGLFRSDLVRQFGSLA